MIKRHKIFVSLEDESLKELRRVLFKRNISPQEFFLYITECVAMGDHRVDAFVEEIAALKQERIEKGEIDKTKLSADALYSAIEQSLLEQSLEEQKKG